LNEPREPAEEVRVFASLAFAVGDDAKEKGTGVTDRKTAQSVAPAYRKRFYFLQSLIILPAESGSRIALSKITQI
jgi:hypothetical protein